MHYRQVIGLTIERLTVAGLRRTFTGLPLLTSWSSSSTLQCWLGEYQLDHTQL